MGGARPFRLGHVTVRDVLPLWKVWIDFSVAIHEHGRSRLALVSLDSYGEAKVLKMK